MEKNTFAKHSAWLMFIERWVISYLGYCVEHSCFCNHEFFIILLHSIFHFNSLRRLLKVKKYAFLTNDY